MLYKKKSCLRFHRTPSNIYVYGRTLNNSKSSMMFYELRNNIGNSTKKVAILKYIRLHRCNTPPKFINLGKGGAKLINFQGTHNYEKRTPKKIKNNKKYSVLEILIQLKNIHTYIQISYKNGKGKN